MNCMYLRLIYVHIDSSPLISGYSMLGLGLGLTRFHRHRAHYINLRLPYSLVIHKQGGHTFVSSWYHPVYIDSSVMISVSRGRRIGNLMKAQGHGHQIHAVLKHHSTWMRNYSCSVHTLRYAIHMTAILLTAGPDQTTTCHCHVHS